MATYGKPTTSFYVNYGDLAATVVTSSLAPVLIAPRYNLHKIESGYADAKLVEVDDNGNAVNVDGTTYPLIDSSRTLPWPARIKKGIIDYTSVRLFAGNCAVILNSGSLSGKVSTKGGLNCIIMDESVQYVDAALADNLRNHEVLAGDTVILTSTDAEGATTTTEAAVVDVLPTMDPTKATVTGVGSADATKLTVDVESFKGDVDCAYLVTVKSVTDAGANVEISAVSGDPGYIHNGILTSDSTRLGSFGSTIATAGTLTAGESYIVRITAERIGSYNRVFVDTLLTEGTYTNVSFASTRIASAVVSVPSAYWDIDDSGVNVLNNILIGISELTYTLHSADLYLEYRELITEDALELRTNQISNIMDWVGPVHPDNPMGMMYAAAAQATGALIYLLATPGSTEADTVKAIEYAGQYESAYAIVPYLQTPVTQAAVLSIINKYAVPTVAQFKHAWFCTTSGRETVIYDSEAGEYLLGSTAINASSGRLTVTLLGDSTDLLKAKVKAGDYLVVVGGYDEDSGKYDEHSYKVTRVTGTNTAEVQGNKVHGISRVYFRRVLSGSEYAAKLADEARAINNYHVNFVASDALSFAGFDNVNPVYLCAVLAANRSILPPHAPMNELVVPGFSVTDAMKWTDTEYEVMNSGGVWVVAKNAEGNLVTFHQITTRTDGTVAEEDSVVSNAESVVRRVRMAVRPYASGKCNVTQALLSEIESTIISTLMQIQNESYNASYGSRVLDFSLPRLEIPEGNGQSVVCYCDIDLPQPLQDGAFYFNLF